MLIPQLSYYEHIPQFLRKNSSSNPGPWSTVHGPGSMAQEHKADEFVTLEQLAACDAMLVALIERLEKGVG